MRGLRSTAIVAVAALVAFGLFRFVVHAIKPPAPAIVVRSTDAHRLLSGSLPARVDRLLHDRPPAASERTGNPRLIALTFDDGPYAVQTPLLLDELAALHVPATFFLVGDDAMHFPGLARRIEAAGDEIANHTLTHPPNFDALSPPEVTHELDAGAAVLERYARDRSIRALMRPPHGRYTEDTVKAAQRDGYDVVLWNDDPGDWRPLTPDVIAEHMGRYATAPEIVLLHSGRQATIEAMPAVVARFRAAGYTFVTVGQMLARVPPTLILHPAKLRV